MELTEASVRNFKCLEHFPAKLPKITLLTGANSSGKSSLINALLGVAQSPEFPFAFSPNGDRVSMGDYEEIIHNHGLEKNVSFTLHYKDDSGDLGIVSATFENNPKTGAPRLKEAVLSNSDISFNISRTRTRYLAKYKILKDVTLTLEKSKELHKIMQGMIKRLARISSDSKDKKIKMPRFPSNTPEEGQFYFKEFSEFIDKATSLPFLPILKSIHIATQNYFQNHFCYVGPFRVSPERTYYRKTKDNLTVDRFGGNAIEQLVDWQTRRSKLYKESVDALRQLGLVDRFEVANLTGGRFEIRVTTSSSGASASLADVGFGICQFLPVLVGDLQLRSQGLFSVSQPEIHLHPKSQALYADYIGNRVRDTKRRYLVETHSEYLINRLRLKIAKGELAETDVALYYLEMKDGTSKIHTIDMMKTGELKNAPDGFFDTYMIDTMSIALESQSP